MLQDCPNFFLSPVEFGSLAIPVALKQIGNHTHKELTESPEWLKGVASNIVVPTKGCVLPGKFPSYKPKSLMLGNGHL